MANIFGVLVVIVTVQLLHPVDGKFERLPYPNYVLLCEDCGHPDAKSKECHGKNASKYPSIEECHIDDGPDPSRIMQYCSRKFVIRGAEDPETSELVERQACVERTFDQPAGDDPDPPYWGCNISHPDTVLSPGTVVECFCNEIRGEEFHEMEDAEDVEPPATPNPELFRPFSFEYCNSRIQCFQCTDCFLPQNPELCRSTRKASNPGETNLVEYDYGRFAFCTVEVKNGIVKRGCAENPINYPNDEWPDCGDMHWNHFLGRCKCFEQRCNNNFFYVHDNLGRNFVERRARFLPTPSYTKFQLMPPPDLPKDSKIKCHFCSVEKGSYYNNCLNKADDNDDTQWEECTGDKPACFREYVHEGKESTAVFKKYMINSKGCVGGKLKSSDGVKYDSSDDKLPEKVAGELYLIDGWRKYHKDENVKDTSNRRIFYCNTDKCNVATKCYQCTGSATQCDTMTDEKLMDCDGEFLQPGETEYSTSRGAVGAAHYCSILISGYLVSRSCRAAIDVGHATGYFGVEKYFPEPCSTWAWKGIDTGKKRGFEECACAANGCNSKEIISLAPRPAVVNLSRNWDDTNTGGVGGGEGGKAEASLRAIGTDSELILFLVTSALFIRV